MPTFHAEFALYDPDAVTRKLYLFIKGLLELNIKTNSYMFVGFEVLTAMVMKSAVFSDVKSCRPVEVHRCFGGTYYLHFQGRMVSQAIDQQESGGSTAFLINVSELLQDYTASHPR
jgi:hypothetical protein